MKITTQIIRQGYDGRRCLVHARACAAPGEVKTTPKRGGMIRGL